jgi:hypothetical protein
MALSIKTPTTTFLSTLDHEPYHMVLAAETKGAKPISEKSPNYQNQSST